MFRRLHNSFRQFMYGRYGTDQLNLFLLCVAVALSLINSILTAVFRNSPVYIMGINPILYLSMLGVLGFTVFRSLSRNIYARQKENRRFNQFWTRLKDHKNRYYHCPNCKQLIRVPKGKGKINIRCPKCGEKFIRKT